MKKYIDIIEELGWTVHDCGDGNLELEKYSPAGEDFIFTVDADDIPGSVHSYYLNFDQDEHISLWAMASLEHTPGVPCIRELVQDAEDIEKMLEELSDALYKIKEAAS